MKTGAAPAEDLSAATDAQSAEPVIKKAPAPAKPAAKAKPDKPAAKAEPAKEVKPAAKPAEAKPAVKVDPAKGAKPAPKDAKPAAKAAPKETKPGTPQAKGAPAPKETKPGTPQAKGVPAPGPAEGREPPAAPASTALPVRSAKEVAKQIRHQRSRRLGIRLLLFVVIPTIFATIYYAVIASNQFESYTVFTVHSTERGPALGLESLIGGVAGAPASRDVLAVAEYVLSRDVLVRLDKEHGFIAHYKDPKIDWLSRLAEDASLEEAYEHYEDKVYADFDTLSGTLTLRVRAFSPEKAREFAQAILEYSEETVNKLSERERKDQTEYAEKEVRLAEKRLKAARQALVKLQQEHAEFNPLQTASAAMEIRTGLEAELAKARAELMQLKSFMHADAPQVRAATERAKSLSSQIAQESRRLVDPKNEAGLNTSLADFEAAMVEKEFAEKAYESTLAALEMARSDAARQHRYVASIAKPSMPDESTYPRRILGVVTVFIVAFLVLGIGTLLVAAVREHAQL